MKGSLSLFFLLASASVALGVDRTVEEGATGSDVVRATVSKMESSGVFSSDRRLLRRIAHVETRDGENGPSQPHGGIWNVPRSAFNTVKQIVSTSQSDIISAAFASEFSQSNIDGWSDLVWEDLDRPLWSALVARLRISVSEEIPTSSDVSGQAQFWRRHYNTNGDVNQFISDVEALDTEESCNIRSDVIFVLDSSGSIGLRNYEEVISFTYNFVELLDIGPEENQVGVVIYSGSAQTVFNLNTYSDKERMLEAIDRIHYIGGGTDTADGLCQMLAGFTEENGARLTEGDVFRLAIVMTDGHSSRSSSRCGSSTLQVAAMVHNFTHPITVYAIGVTSSVNEEELEAIASKKEYITYLSNFDDELFRETIDEQRYELCEKTSIPVELGVQRGRLQRGGRVRYELKVPQEGVTVKLCVNGSVVFYGSHEVPNPNEALYDYTQEATSTSSTACSDVYVPLPKSVETASIENNNEGNNEGTPSHNITISLYMSLEGIQEQNDFELETLRGDRTKGNSKQEEWPVIVIGTLISVGMVVLVAFIVSILVVFYIWRKKQMSKDVAS